MLLIQARKRSRATFDYDHTTSHPASWQSDAKEVSADMQTSTDTVLSILSNMRGDSISFSRSFIAALSLEQLQELSTQISDRIHIKKRYNNTPLRRIIARQVSGNSMQAPIRSEEDTLSQTSTLVNREALEAPKESPETIQARYNNTPLRRILGRQVFVKPRTDTSRSASAILSHEPESLEVRKARYNNTPLRRLILQQAPDKDTEELIESASVQPSPTTSPVSVQSLSSISVPRSDTPLRRILSRQASAQSATVTKRDDDELSDRADSVICPDSPIVSLELSGPSSLMAGLNSEATIRAYEEALWSKPASSSATQMHLNPEARVRAYEEAVWAKQAKHIRLWSSEDKTQGSVITVTEISIEAKAPKRIVVDSKSSPLRRILQRQTSRDWRAPARVSAV